MKRIVSWLCTVVLCLCLGASVSAQSLDTERECSLALQYAKEGVAFADVEISLYRVAQANPDGTFDKVAPFDAYAVSIYDVVNSEDWSILANTLSGYIEADALFATATDITDAEGKAVFTELPTGLYLVAGAMGENEKGVYTFDPFMVYLPTHHEGVYQYDVVAKPKADHFEPAPKGTEYRVLKLWEDIGYTSHRTAIQVELRKDDEVVETVTLSDANNWTYAWTDPGQGVWTVVERDVPEGYTVHMNEKGTTFILTNMWNPDTPPEPEEPTDPPETGDTSPIWLYVLVLCLSGFGLIIVGLALLRGNRYEKKRQ